ncbi:uncharacterized protein EI90DRAFT_3084583, partial [Cantharellus anzutake]|uniref:uncharacterized protein n=1 Tax=Cantharellus anzutake TaxID=1750568 RepID=UPI00190325E1
ACAGAEITVVLSTALFLVYVSASWKCLMTVFGCPASDWGTAWPTQPHVVVEVSSASLSCMSNLPRGCLLVRVSIFLPCLHNNTI